MKKYIILAMLSSAFMIAEVALDLIQPRMMARNRSRASRSGACTHRHTV